MAPDPPSLTPLQQQWTTLYRHTLPSAARAEHGASAAPSAKWPVHLDHCFARIILDNAVGVDRPWTAVLKAPATRNMTEEQLRSAIALGETVWTGEADLWALDRHSLVLRGKADGRVGKRKRVAESAAAVVAQVEPGDSAVDQDQTYEPKPPRTSDPPAAALPPQKKSRKQEMADIWSTFPTSTIKRDDNDNDNDNEARAARQRIAADLTLKPFRRRVLTLLTQVPRGRYTTYQALSDAASKAGSGGGGTVSGRGCARAIGSVMRNNPFAPAVPCHRVLASDGRIGGFKGEWGKDGEGGGAFVKEKIRMLREEGVRFDGRGKVVGECFRGFVD